MTVITCPSCGWVVHTDPVEDDRGLVGLDAYELPLDQRRDMRCWNCGWKGTDDCTSQAELT